MQTKYIVGSVVLVLLVILGLGTVFSGTVLAPQALHVGSWQLQLYGVCMAAAVLVGHLIAQQRRSRFALTSQTADAVIFWVVIAGFLGARAYHVISDFNYYWVNPGEVLQVWHGGLSIYGALIGGLLGLLVWVMSHHSKPERLSVYARLLDWLTPSILAGQIIGRFGNFFNYELFGYPTNVPWKMFVPEQFRSPGYFAQSFYHPLFLYEALANLVILLFLYRYIDQKTRPGALFLWYVLLYNVSRFFLEFLRIDAVFVGDFRINAGVSALLVISTVVILIARHARKVPQTH